MTSKGVSCGACGFGSRKVSKKVSHRKRRSSRKVSHKRRGSKKVSHRKRRGSKRGSKRRNHKKSKMSFGKIGSSLSFMGNNPGNSMSTFQQYTGMSPGQMSTHMTNVPTNLRSNFYTDV